MMGFRKNTSSARWSWASGILLGVACQQDADPQAASDPLMEADANGGDGAASGGTGATGSASEPPGSGGSVPGAGAASGGGSGTGESSEPLSMEEAARLYSLPIPGGNTFACVNCHALQEPPADTVRRVAHEIGTATTRTSYKNGETTSLLDAVNSCLTEWMKLRSGWTEETRAWQGLRAFLEMMNPGAGADTISYTIVDPLAGPDALGGDPAAGRELFNVSCVQCHGFDAVGSVRGPPLQGALLSGQLEGPAAYVARRVRLSGTRSLFYPRLEGGSMPFWASDRLSDDELRNIAAFLSTNVVTPGDAPGTTTTELRDCPASHEKVGQVTELMGPLAMGYGVSGTAHIVDDCTVELRDFTFNGSGVVVEIYGGVGSPVDYFSGFPMSEDLVNGLFDGVTMRVQLPEDRSLDELTGVSVWCSAVGQDFGSGEFVDP